MKKIIVIITLFLGIQVISAQQAALAMQNDIYGYIKKDGSWLIKPQYIKAGSFSNGLAPVYSGEKWGFVNSSNELVIDYAYDRVKAFDSGIAVVLKDKRWFYIDKKGVEITTMPFSEKAFDFNDGVAFIRRGDKTGLINASGKVLIEPTYDKILKFHNGYAKMKLGDYWGIIDVHGKEVVKPFYKELGSYSQGVVRANKQDAIGLIINGEFKVLEVLKIWDFKNNEKLTYALNNEKKVGFINRKGDWVIEPRFKKVKGFTKGLAPVSTTGKRWGYVNENGDIVVSEKYKDAEIFSADGLAPVKINKLWGFINTKEDIIAEYKYIIKAKSLNIFKKQSFGFVDGLARVSFEKKWGFLDKKGNVLNDTWYQRLEKFTDTN